MPSACAIGMSSPSAVRSSSEYGRPAAEPGDGRRLGRRPAAGFEVGAATAWRYVTETVALLAARAPKLRQVVRAAKKAGRLGPRHEGRLDLGIGDELAAAGLPALAGKGYQGAVHARTPYRAR